MKKQIRNGAALLLAAALLLSAAACTKEEDSSSESTSSASSSSAEVAEATDTKTEESAQDSESSSEGDETSAAAKSADGTTVTQPKAEVPEQSKLSDMDYDLTYEEDEVPEACAQAIAAYFYSIETQNYDLYQTYLYPPYAEQMESWLQENYGYGLETALESFHQMLTDNGGSDSFSILSISMKQAEAASEEDSSFLEDYLTTYNSILGDSFSEEVKSDADQVWDIAVTIQADCGGTETELITDNEMLIVEKDGAYTILG